MLFNGIEFNSKVSSTPISSIKIEKEFIDELKAYNKSSRMNKMSKEDYRDRIDKLYNDIGSIKPIDNEINDVIYFDSYDEAGLVLNKKDISLKQIWTEYRLIYNEKKKEDDKIMENSFVLDNFDDLFDRITSKVDGLDKYIFDLNSLKKEVDNDRVNFKKIRESLEIDRINFENYRRSEIARLEQKERELNEKLDKINKLVNILDEKISFFESDISKIENNDEKI